MKDPRPLPKEELRFRDYILTGLTALLPLWLTGYILWFLIQLTGNLLFPIVRPLLRRALHKAPPEELLVAITALVVCGLIWGMGYLVIHVFGHGHISRIESLIARVPVARTIHSIIRRLVDALLASRRDFQSVVRVEFPIPGQYAIGFVTSGDLESPDDGQLISVMVPTAPNPTSGFLLFVPRHKLAFVPMSVDEAMTLVLSMGTFGAPRLGPGPDRAAAGQ